MKRFAVSAWILQTLLAMSAVVLLFSATLNAQVDTQLQA